MKFGAKQESFAEEDKMSQNEQWGQSLLMNLRQENNVRADT